MPPATGSSPYVCITADTHAGAAIDAYREYLDRVPHEPSTSGAAATRTRQEAHRRKKTKNWDSAERLADLEATAWWAR